MSEENDWCNGCSNSKTFYKCIPDSVFSIALMNKRAVKEQDQYQDVKRTDKNQCIVSICENIRTHVWLAHIINEIEKLRYNNTKWK